MQNSDVQREPWDSEPPEVIEWVEYGWPLREDGSCDTRSAREVEIVAASQGLASVDSRSRRMLFPSNGGPWSALGTRAEEQARPRAFPGCLVLKREPQLRRYLDRDLVLALVEWRTEPSERRFRRCVWFVLPASWSRDLDPYRVGLACEMLLSHRGRRGPPRETRPLRVPSTSQEELRIPRMLQTQGGISPEDGATPVELLMGLVDYVVESATSEAELSECLEDGLAVLCARSKQKYFGMSVPLESNAVLPSWQHPVPQVGDPWSPNSRTRSDQSSPALGRPPISEPSFRAADMPRAPRRLRSAVAVEPPAEFIDRSPRHGFKVLGSALVVLSAVQLLLLAWHISVGPAAAPDTGTGREASSAGLAVAKGAAPPEPSSAPGSATQRVVSLPTIAFIRTRKGQSERLDDAQIRLIRDLPDASRPRVIVGFSDHPVCREAKVVAEQHAKHAIELLQDAGVSVDVRPVLLRRDRIPTIPATMTAGEGALILPQDRSGLWRSHAKDCIGDADERTEEKR